METLMHSHFLKNIKILTANFDGSSWRPWNRDWMKCLPEIIIQNLNKDKNKKDGENESTFLKSWENIKYTYRKLK